MQPFILSISSCPLCRDMALMPGLLLGIEHLISGPLTHLALPVAAALIAVLVILAALAEGAAADHARVGGLWCGVAGVGTDLGVKGHRVVHVYLALTEDFDRVLGRATKGNGSFLIEVTYVDVSSVGLLVLLYLLIHETRI